MKLFIKNMVCARCILAVERELKELNLYPKSIELGIIEFDGELHKEHLQELHMRIVSLGFEILQNKKSQAIEQVKCLLIKKLQQNKIEKHFGIAKYLSIELKKDYTNLSKLFSEEGITIEQYFILLKLERAKELISYGELTLCGIAETLGYSSVQHLSSQFKRVLGISATNFKLKQRDQRKSIDEVSYPTIKV